ncbi:MAG: hypothetical protein JRI68_12755 [Deltaproteobacteria bacterium]|nr:hypothetical protein [Deltaproteobacteria bacterium]
MDLKHWITSAGRLNSEDAVGWALRLAKTIALLHRRGLAHGRISLNAVESDGPECDTAAALRPASRVTEDEAYLSSERLTGAAPTPADDVWAIGVVLYRVLTGELPFVDTAVSGQQPVAIVQAVGAELAAIQPVFDRVFHRDRAERIVTAHDLVVVLSGHHPRAAELEALELPTESIRLAHRVKHVSQPLLEAVRQEQDALPALLGGEVPGGGEHEFDEDAPRRDSEAVFLGWLSEPPPAAAEETPQPSTPVPASSDESPSEYDELDDWEDDEDDRPTLMRPLAPSLEPPAEQGGEEAESGDGPDEPSPPPSGSSSDEAGAGTSARGAAPAAASAVEPAPVPAQVAEPRPTKRSRPVALWLVVAGLGALVVVLAFLRLGGDPPSDRSGRSARSAPSAAAPGPSARQSAAPPPTAEPSPAVPPLTAATSATTPLPTTASSAVATPPSASATAAPVVPSSSSRPPAVGDRDACMRALFPADTFSDRATPNFDRVCRRGHPRKGAEAIKGLVVAGGNRRALTTGMKEWSLLGWYNMAAFTVVHGHCCESAIDLSHPSFKICGLGDALEALHAAARGRPTELDAATEAYRKAASCTWRSNNAKMFQQTTQPTSQQLATYRKILDRMTR